MLPSNLKKALTGSTRDEILIRLTLRKLYPKGNWIYAAARWPDFYGRPSDGYYRLAGEDAMARLLFKGANGETEVFELNLGVNRFGRHPDNDFSINHKTISATHCEIVLTAEAVLIRDCDSTNGTFINDEPVREAVLQRGQTLRLGDVEFFVEMTEVTVAIPQFDRLRPAPPVVLTDGTILCPRHAQSRATHRCTHCHEVLCDACVHRLRRSGGKLLKLCGLCSHPCEPIGPEKRRKKSLLTLLNKTIKIPFLGNKKD